MRPWAAALLAFACGTGPEAPEADTSAAERIEFDVGKLSGDLDADENLTCAGSGTLTVDIEGVPPLLDVILVLDSSTSVSNTQWNMVEDAAAAFVQNVVDVGSNRDRVAVVQYGTDVHLRHRFNQTQNANSIASAIKNLSRLGGYTHTKDAINTAISHFDSQGRSGVGKVLVLVTDGAPNPSSQSPCSLKSQLDSRGIASPPARKARRPSSRSSTRGGSPPSYWASEPAGPPPASSVWWTRPSG